LVIEGLERSFEVLSMIRKTFILPKAAVLIKQEEEEEGASSTHHTTTAATLKKQSEAAKSLSVVEISSRHLCKILLKQETRGSLFENEQCLRNMLLKKRWGFCSPDLLTSFESRSR